MAHYLDTPLETYLAGDTHIRIRCAAISGCRHQVVMLTRELLDRVPKAKTVRDLKARLRCQKCGAKGWCHVDPAGR